MNIATIYFRLLLTVLSSLSVVICFSQPASYELMKSSSSGKEIPFTLHSFLSTNAIFQRNKPIPIIGKGNANEEVQIIWKEASYKTEIDDHGKLAFYLPEESSGGPYELTITTQDTSILLSNILIGDVWFASGQSNMEWSIEKLGGGFAEIQSANFENIRLFKAPRVMEFFPITDWDMSPSWKKAKGDAIAHFSAVAY